jgi:hypothetical protein
MTSSLLAVVSDEETKSNEEGRGARGIGLAPGAVRN